MFDIHIADDLKYYILNANNAGKTVALKLQLEPTHCTLPTGVKKKRSSNGLKPGRQLFCRIDNGHIGLHLGDFGPPGARPLKDCCGDPIIAWMDQHRGETDSEGEEGDSTERQSSRR